LAEIHFVADETDWSLERHSSLYTPPNIPGIQFGHTNTGNQAF